MDTMTTVSQVLNHLKKEGYSVDFNLNDTCLVCHGNSLQIYPNDFVVDEHYRFEGISDPGDEAIVYAISSPKHNVKGTLVNGYGIYSDEIADGMIKALKEKAANSAPAKVKYNEATPQRPQGERPLNAPLVLLNLPEYISQIKQEQAWQTNDRNSITLFKSDSMRLVLIALHGGAELKTHTAPGVISVQVLEGQIEFEAEQEVHQLSAGQALALQAKIPHAVKALQESVFLLTLAVGK